jgi:SAM-dependent methyltransferase/DNA-binding Lrp family transcriptional regulator
MLVHRCVFAAAIETLQQQGVAVFLEIGPGSTLIGMGERCLVEAEDQPPLWRASLKPSAGDWASLLESVAALYRAGVPIDWEAVDGRTGMRRVELPTYPFQRQRYWLPHLPGSRRSGQGGAELHPLLGRRLHSALPGAQFEKELGADAIAYLNDHRVQGAAILPGAGFMEAALAAAALVGGGLSVHDMLLLETLAVPDGARRVVQWIVTPQGEGEYKFACYSRETGESDDWRLHAEARLAPAASGLAGALAARFDLAALQTALPEVVEAEAHYAQLAANGLDFGPSLLGVTRLWRRDGEALGHIAPTECVAAEAQAYHLHPALLDAHLQVMAAAMPPQAAAHLPFSLDALRVLLPGVQPVWSHVVVHSSGESGATVRADLHLLGDRGEVVAILDGLHLKRLESGAGGTQSMAPFAGWLYEVEWVAQGVEDAGATARTAGVAPRAADVASAWPALPAVGEDVARRLEELEDEHQLATYALDVAPLLDRLSMAYIVAALRKLGWEPQTGEHFTPAALAQSLGIAQRHLRLLGRLCEILAEEGVLTADGVGWQVAGALTAEDAAEVERSLRQRHGAYAAEIDLVARCGRQLAEALSGRIDPVHLLFPQGDLSTTEALYRESPSARVYNGLMRATVEMLVVRRNAGLQTSLPAALAVVEDRSLTLGDMKPLRVLEIGGGTGGTTAYLLPMLPAEQTSYLFTDISPLFVARAEEKFGPHHEFASFAVLDLEKDPAQQGLGEHQFDLIVAANVVHATADLRKSLAHIRRLLAPDGLLVMLEVTGPQRWVDVTFGLTDGWWRFVDADLRPGYPLLAIAQWKELLESCGFDAVVTAPGEDGAGFIDQAVIMAHQPFGPGALLPGSAGAAADLGHWLVLADHGGTGEQLAQQLAQAGAGVTVAFAGAADMHQADGSFQVDPMQPEQIRGLMHSWSGQAGEKTLAGVVYLWGLDTPAGELDAKALAGTLAPSTAGALHLVQALAAHTGEATPRVWFVTRGAQAVTHAGDLPSVAQSPLWGFVQAVTLEHPELRPVLVDLDGAGAQADMAVDVNCLMAELLPARRGVSGVDDSTAGDAEDRVAWRAGQRFVARLEPRRITSRRQGGAQAGSWRSRSVVRWRGWRCERWNAASRAAVKWRFACMPRG